MRTLATIIFFTITNMFYCNAQTSDSIVDSYLEKCNPSKGLKLNHGPIDAGFSTLKNGKIFFINGIDIQTDNYENHAVLYDYTLDSYTTFGYNGIDPSYGNVVISAFFENIDNDPENELLVIYEYGGRTHYLPKGGYAGIKVSYQTRVFDLKRINNTNVITEYKTIGNLLSVNLPPQMGSFEEEVIIGREESLGKLNNILGVTYNAHQVKKRISLLKENGFLGGARNKH